MIDKKEIFDKKKVILSRISGNTTDNREVVQHETTTYLPDHEVKSANNLKNAMSGGKPFCQSLTGTLLDSAQGTKPASRARETRQAIKESSAAPNHSKQYNKKNSEKMNKSLSFNEEIDVLGTLERGNGDEQKMLRLTRLNNIKK